MIKVILFYIGGVLVDQKRLVEKFIGIFKPKNTLEFLNHLNLEVTPLCKNLMTEKQFWVKFSKKYKVQAQQNLWTKDFEKLTKINHKVLNIAKGFKPRYKIGIISNTISPHVEINKKRGLFDIFDSVVLSCEANLAKDSKKIFLLAAKKLKVRTQECVFIDDVNNFVEIAKSAGMKGILFKNPVQLNKELKRMLRNK